MRGLEKTSGRERTSGPCGGNKRFKRKKIGPDLKNGEMGRPKAAKKGKKKRGND